MESNIATSNNDFPMELRRVPLAKIKTNPYQPRKFFSDNAIKELAGSIANVGLLQPIAVRELDGSYELIAGERRMRACKLLGWSTIPAIIENRVNKDSAILSMIENLQRENLHFFEEAEGFLNLIREHGMTQEELARKMSKSQSAIANKIRLLKLPKSVKAAVLKFGLTERHARSILRLHDEKIQMRVIRKIVEDSLSVKSTEELVEKELHRMYGETRENKKAFRIGYRIYYNSILKVVSRIREMGEETMCRYNEYDDRVEMIVTIAKKELKSKSIAT